MSSVETVTAAATFDDPGAKVWGAFIGGAFVDVGDSDTFVVTEPATGRELARVVAADAELVDRAVRDARRAYEEDWRDRSRVSAARCCAGSRRRSARTCRSWRSWRRARSASRAATRCASTSPTATPATTTTAASPTRCTAR